MKKKWWISILASLFLLGGCMGTGMENSNSGTSNGGETSSDSAIGNQDCIDTDNNGVCDDCNKSVLITLDIYAVNDLHGKILDNDSQEGVDELSTYLSQAREQNEYTVVLSSGDMWQGTAEAGLTYGKLVTDWMNEMEFASMTLGNHEYDWGEEYIIQNEEMANFPFLAINVFDRQTNKRVEYCQPSVMVEINGVKIGIIGAMGDCYSSISSDKVQNVYFKTGSQLTALVKAEAAALKKQGADCIIYSWHDGKDSDNYAYDESLSNGYVDVVFEGHSHQKYTYKDRYGVWHLQGGGDNDGITRAKVMVNFARNESITGQANTISTSTYKNLDDHPVVNELTEKYSAEISLARKELGGNDTFRSSWDLRRKVAELYYQVGVETWGDEYDIVLGGGYLSARYPYEIYAGMVTYSDLYNIFPFNNPIVLCKISGAKLRSQFFETTNSNYFIAYGEYGAEVKENIDSSKTYYIVIDTYSSLYSYNGATEIARYDETTYARDLLADYIEAGGFTETEEDDFDPTDKDDTTDNDNTGDNTGDNNTDNDNTGDNTGDNNTDNDNTGDNTGDNNTGDDNTGDNTGDNNTGDDNTGDNTGDNNTGNDNTGDNTGDDNIGDDNAGDDNAGDDNAGDDSTGDDNTGDDSNDNLQHSKQDCVDGNDDGVCDTCEQSVIITLDIFAINDLHGKVLDNDSQEGVDELSTYLNNAKNTNEYTIFLSSGDMWQGMAESNLTYGNLVTDWMNAMGCVSMTLGNHEYDWGEEYIIQNANIAQFPFLAINVYSKTTNQRVQYCQPSLMVEINGIKIGIIGAMGDCYSSISSDKVANVYFKTGAELTALVKAESIALREAGADCIIYSFHDSYDNYDEALSNGYVDIVFEGHSHQKYTYQDSYGVWHLQGGGDNKGITSAKIELNFARNEARTQQAKTVAVSVYQNLEDHPIVEQLTEKYSAQISLARKKLGQNDVERSSTVICETVAQLYYQVGLETWGDKYDIVLGGGYLKTRSPYDLAAGTVLYGDLYNILPFDNQIVLCSISGSKLRSQFFETTNSNYHIAYGAYGESVKNDIISSRTYYIVLDTYSSQYSYNGATEIARYSETIYARDLLADYIEAGGFTTSGGSGNTGGENSGSDNNPNESYITSISEILRIGSTLSAGEMTAEYYYVKGTIKDTPNSTYGNCTIVDENGNELWVYGINDKNGNRYGYSTFDGDKPKKGDTIIIYAPVMRYVNNNTGEDKLELYQSVFIQKVNS